MTFANERPDKRGGTSPRFGRTARARFLASILAAGVALTSCVGPEIKAATQVDPGSQRPNFLLIVADDLAYSDIGAFGGEIDTPNLDRLAVRGARLTDFHVAPSCSPTRAMLLTGNDSHFAGLGGMAEALRPEQRGRPGYEGHLNGSVATIAERLHDAGYFTAMTGKWHLGGGPGQIPAARGFDRSFALINGAANYFGKDQDAPFAGTLFGSIYYEEGTRARLPDGAYTTDYFTSRLVEFLDRNRRGSRKPFFAYLAFNAPHTPLQAPAALIAKYRGRYDDGPRALRAMRLRQLFTLGIISRRVRPARMLDTLPWADLSAAQRAAQARRMEVYAAAVDSLDGNVGKVLRALKRNGDLKNTIVIFMSDNGAEGVDENLWLDFLQKLGLPNAAAKSMRAANADLARVGSSDGYVAYGPGWAQAGMAPFSLTKSYTSEGGIRAPLIVAGPGIVRDRILHEFANVTDIVPTILDMAGVSAREGSSTRQVRPPQGVSLASLLRNGHERTGRVDRAAGWELFGRRAVRFGPWKAVYQNRPIVKAGAGAGPAHWSLYNLDRDPGETEDLATNDRAMMQALLAKWDAYAAENGVIPVYQIGAQPQGPGKPGAN